MPDAPPNTRRPHRLYENAGRVAAIFTVCRSSLAGATGSATWLSTRPDGGVEVEADTRRCNLSNVVLVRVNEKITSVRAIRMLPSGVTKAVWQEGYDLRYTW